MTALFMHTGTQRKYVSMCWRVPGARAGEEDSSILDCCCIGWILDLLKENVYNIPKYQETKSNISLRIAYDMERINMPAVMSKGSGAMEIKKISISAKRQITIPQKFFAMLGFDAEAECMVRGNELVIRPVKTNTGGEFAEQILTDLIAKDYSGNELLEQFKKMQSQVRPAVEAMIAEAQSAAASEAEYMSYEDVFGGEEIE